MSEGLYQKNFSIQLFQVWNVMHADNHILSVEQFIINAINETGLDDWGDESFREPLQILIDNVNKNNTSFSPSEKEDFIKLIHVILTNRLLVQSYIKRNPEILEVPIVRPLFIIGLARTGSTLLQRLLAQDPYCRAPLYWEMVRPLPPPDALERNNDPRIKMAEEEIKLHKQRSPNFQRIHNKEATDPEECGYLLRNTFMTAGVFNKWGGRNYSQWLDKQDRIVAYQYYRILLQILLWRCPGSHLVLKSPNHLPFVDKILKVFPDANFIWIHRNPLEVVPSDCSLRGSGRQRKDLTKTDYKKIAEQLAQNVKKGMKLRKNANPRQFYDVKYADLLRNPIATIKSIYEYFNYDYPPKTEEGINNWLSNNPQNKYGAHEYGLQQFGLDENEIRQLFSGYCESFKIEMV